MPTPIASSAFARLFRPELNSLIEYSFGADPATYGTMVVGRGESFLERLHGFAALAPDGWHWSAAIRRLVDAAWPPALFLKVEGDVQRLDVFTLYGRFFKPVDEAACLATLAPASAFAWHGPSPQALGQLMDRPGPQGIGLRSDSAGGRASALYFDVPSSRDDFCAGRLHPLVSALDWPSEVGDAIADDIMALYGPGKLGIVGIGSGAEEGQLGLKFDCYDLPLRKALAFLAAKGMPPVRCRELADNAQGLRCERTSYVSIKFGADGFSGCKLYLAVRTRDLGSVLTGGATASYRTGRPDGRALSDPYPTAPIMWGESQYLPRS